MTGGEGQINTNHIANTNGYTHTPTRTHMKTYKDIGSETDQQTDRDSGRYTKKHIYRPIYNDADIQRTKNRYIKGRKTDRGETHKAREADKDR